MLLNKNSKVYVVCPANVATGGPELLHQLVYKLNIFGIEAYMYYYNTKKGKDPVHDEYKTWIRQVNFKKVSTCHFCFLYE